MLDGYKGKLLFINLNQENHEIISIPEEILVKYIGGRGLGSKLYWDLLSPQTGALEPDNLFMVITGPLGGTMALGSAKHVIITKSPTTGGWLESYSSGRVSPELKYAGFDALIIKGKAHHPLYLTIEDDLVSYHDAMHLWGKGAFETEIYMKERFHPECGCLSIGPAGENLLQFACVGSDFFRKAGRGGTGAVMGSKNLKSIAIKGSGGVECAKMDKLSALTLKLVKKRKRRIITPMTLSITNAAGMLPTRNFTIGHFPKAKDNIDMLAVNKLTTSFRACFACFASCSNITKVKDGEFKNLILEGPEYETLSLLGSNLEIDYLPAIMKANYLCDDLGMDTISSGVIIGFVMECFERGLLTIKDTDGLELKFGNYKEMIKLLELMAHKKGFGNFCAQGVKKMSEQLKKGTEDFALHSKGLEFPGYDPRAGWGSTITYSVTPRGACHRRAWPPAKEILGGIDPFTTENKAEMVIELMNERCILHNLIVCDFPAQALSFNKKIWCDYLNYITGLKYTWDELNFKAEIIETLIRRINLREGLTYKDDMLPKRILEESLIEGPAKGKIIGNENFLKMRMNYYLNRGWNEVGVPTRETLTKYDFSREPKITLKS
ncbi:MAG: aldehyde ferredoxin oxidoreductase family protein [Promethearchaeota archaeon]